MERDAGCKGWFSVEEVLLATCKEFDELGLKTQDDVGRTVDFDHGSRVQRECG